jgi:predicted DNA-binding transcriptional regulator AlpA
MTPDLDTNEFVSLAEFAKILKVSPKTIRNKRSADPDYFPPVIRITGFRKILWKRTELQSWFSNKIQPRSKE